MSTGHDQRSEHDPAGDRSDRLSNNDPRKQPSASRPPILLIVIVVLLVTGFVVLHLTGVVGPGSH